MAYFFPALQGMYAAQQIATYPLTADKTPAVKHYQLVGAPYSHQLGIRFPDATAAGFVAGRRNGLTIVDIDSSDDRLLEDAVSRFGQTPFQVATPSGGRHLYYRHNGEPRRIRPMADIDVLGAGNVVAALSVTPRGTYRIERGSLDDLAKLPPIRPASVGAPKRSDPIIPHGQRNNALFNHWRKKVDFFDTFDEFHDAARYWAETSLSSIPLPVSDAEIERACRNIWTFRGGGKRMGELVVQGEAFRGLERDPETSGVFLILQAHNARAGGKFMFADGFGSARGWPRRLVPAARKKLLDLKVIECVRLPAKDRPGLYRWGPAIERGSRTDS